MPISLLTIVTNSPLLYQIQSRKMFIVMQIMVSRLRIGNRAYLARTSDLTKLFSLVLWSDSSKSKKYLKLRFLYSFQTTCIIILSLIIKGDNKPQGYQQKKRKCVKVTDPKVRTLGQSNTRPDLVDHKNHQRRDKSKEKS